MANIQGIRDVYGVPAKRGGRVIYTGKKPAVKGTITGARDGYIRIRLDGEPHPKSFHPTWELEYLQPAAKER